MVNEKLLQCAPLLQGRSVGSGGASVAYRIALSAQAAPHACCCRHHWSRRAGARDEFGPRLARFLFWWRPEAAAPDLVFRQYFQRYFATTAVAAGCRKLGTCLLRPQLRRQIFSADARRRLTGADVPSLLSGEPDQSVLWLRHRQCLFRKRRTLRR